MNFHQVLEFDSLAALNAAPHGWDADIRQLRGLDRGGAIGITGSANVIINRVDLTCATLQRGSTPVGMRTFSLLIRQLDDHAFRGHPVDRNSVIIFPRDRELHAVSSGGVQILNVSINEPLRARAANQLELPASYIDGLPTTVSFSDAERAGLLRRIEILAEFTGKYGNHQRAVALSRALEEELVCAVLDALVNISRCGQRISPNSRYRATRTALDYILARPSEAITVTSLAEEVGASRRTLEKGFMELLEMPPGQFIKATRLQGCREELQSVDADAGVAISQVAGRWGFWHMGQFAADYRREFGELPSQTLRSA